MRKPQNKDRRENRREVRCKEKRLVQEELRTRREKMKGGGRKNFRMMRGRVEKAKARIVIEAGSCLRR